ncbi:MULTISPECIES: hypothetical protein [Bradyrhizobium]|uniref:Uncharacterized protein n=1 Tax=Bradyrhizobium vignae TaxID=1549949 RepID=A0A2U3Q6M2_9BRAD|nr:hypothetical protein [Bradyrhizobium vignae]MBP0112135.1 hypothetical protein [Bradyrhizobium vignae]SPP97085.1 protein of unknown function [Bradyrhizobium vignae]
MSAHNDSFSFSTGISIAASHVPVLSELIANDHAYLLPPPTHFAPTEPCFPVIEHLFGEVVAPPPGDGWLFT